MGFDGRSRDRPSGFRRSTHEATAMTDYRQELADAFSRVNYDLALLRKSEGQWEPDTEHPGMHVFRGGLDAFVVKKYCVDLLREVWHIGDGIREVYNEAWRNGTAVEGDLDLDKGNGPGKAIVRALIDSTPALQVCGDLANLSKHYRLVHKTQTGGPPPQFGESALHMRKVTGKLQVGGGDSPTVKIENPVPVTNTMTVLDADGKEIGDVVQLAADALDAWRRLIEAQGLTLEVKGAWPTP